MSELSSTLGPDDEFSFAVTGSVGLGVAERYDLAFVQEVVTATEFTKQVHPEVSTIIDIGGEDAKIVYLAMPQYTYYDKRIVNALSQQRGTSTTIDMKGQCRWEVQHLL